MNLVQVCHVLHEMVHTHLFPAQKSNILAGLNIGYYSQCINMMESAIVSSDRSSLFHEKLDAFSNLVLVDAFNLSDTVHRGLFRGMLLAACEVSVMAKPWNTVSNTQYSSVFVRFNRYEIFKKYRC